MATLNRSKAVAQKVAVMTPSRAGSIFDSTPWNDEKAHNDNVAIKSNYSLVYGFWFSIHHSNRPLTGLWISFRTQRIILLGFVCLILELLLYFPCFYEPLNC